MRFNSITFFLQALLISFITISFGNAQENIRTISIADTNAYGNLVLYDYEGWQFSFDGPTEIKDRLNLRNTRSIDIRNIKELKEDSEWNEYGWFELELVVDSTIAGIPWVLSHRGHEPVKVWLNGIEILKNGNPSTTPEDEVLSRFINAKQTGIILREGANYFLFEYSEHTAPTYFKYWQWFDNGIHLLLYKNYEPYQRRHRAFMFGGALMLLLLLVLIHAYLAIKFKGEYHTYVSLTTFSLLLVAFTTLSDTLIDWTYSYLYFFEFSYVIFLVLIAYFFLISVRMIFRLTVPWNTLSFICGGFIVTGIISIYVNRAWLNIIHPIMLIATLLYVFYSLWKAKKQNPNAKTGIVSIGIIGTVLGSILYTLPYLAFNIDNHALLLISVILSFTGVPISLTFNVARNYADLISTLEAKVQDRTAALESANEYQKRFFANISHEFRTPLTISEGLINKIIRAPESDPSRIQHDLSIAKRNMVRLHDMVDQIIDLTKADQNHLTLNQEYFTADFLASISVESFRSLAEYHGHRFEFYPNAEEATLYVDRSKVEIMINNLISNAIKFTPDGGNIVIKTEISEGFFELKVMDSGPGIPASEEEAIFERFHRIKRDDADYVEGMGVGLELSRVLARLHSGEIQVDTSYKKGACFKLSLPIAEVKDGEIIPKLESIDEDLIYGNKEEVILSKHKNFEILLVEDNADMMEYVSAILEELGTLRKARNGKEALDILPNFTPDIIITDLMMPIMGGDEFVRKLFEHEHWKQIPVIVLTAKALDENKLNLLRIGVVDYITKPFSPEQLLLKTKNLLTYYTRRKKLKLGITTEDVQTDSDFLKKLTVFVSKNISNTNLSVDLLANEFSQSRSSLYRNLQLETGMTPAEFIREIRLSSAQQLIAQKQGIRLEELANAVGYKSATSFRKMYEERFGEHPLN